MVWILHGTVLCLVSPIEVVQSKLARPTFVAVFTASCNGTGPTYLGQARSKCCSVYWAIEYLAIHLRMYYLPLSLDVVLHCICHTG